MLKKYTTIDEQALALLGIDRDEYALCSYVQFRQADPAASRPGWCCDSKAEIAAFVRKSRQGIYKMIDRLEVLRLLHSDPTTGALRVTSEWLLAHTANCQLSLQTGKDGVNLVDKECQLSLQTEGKSVNLVDTHIKVKNDLLTEIECETRAHTHAHAIAENEPSQIPTPSPPIPPAPPSPSEIAWANNPDDLITRLRDFYQASPADWLVVVEKLQLAAVRAGQQKYTPDEIKDAVTRYCEWAIENNLIAWQYGRHNARLRRWMGDEPTKNPRSSTNHVKKQSSGRAQINAFGASAAVYDQPQVF